MSKEQTTVTINKYLGTYDYVEDMAIEEFNNATVRGEA